ncbi:MAG: discoidin domain-containing protein [Saccharofermentanales bacterium]
MMGNNELKFVRIIAQNGIAVSGAQDCIKIYLENTGYAIIDDLVIVANTDDDTIAEQKNSAVKRLDPGEVMISDWIIKSKTAGQKTICFKALYNKKQQQIEDEIRLLFVDHYHENKLCMNMKNEWEILENVITLQDKNNSQLIEIPVKKSKDIKSNRFGVSAQIPRDYDEDPFNIANLSDGDRKTGWASRSNRVAYPSIDEWVCVDLGRKREINAIGLIPFAKGSGFPVNFDIEGNIDGEDWILLRKVIGYKLDITDVNKDFYDSVVFNFEKIKCDMVRIRFYKMTNYRNDFFCRPFSPYQVRLSGVEIYDVSGNNIIDRNEARITCSSTDNAWYNTKESISETWPDLFELGVKWNRIGQWGDMCEWASVEKEKGKYTIDPILDEKITESVENGIDIIMTLDYGNELYLDEYNPCGFIGVWKKGHPHLLNAPSSDDEIAGYVNYCRHMVSHFKDRIKYWEIWNEENGWFNPDSDPVRYGKLLKTAAIAIKEIDPNAIVMMGGIACFAPEYIEKVLEQGAGPYIDIIAYHPYGRILPESSSGTLDWKDGKLNPVKSEETGIRDCDEEIEILKKRISPFNDKLQIWENEMNWFAPGQPASDEWTGFFRDTSDITQAKYLARWFILNLAADISSIWWSLYNENYTQEWALIRSGTKKKSIAYFVLQRISSIFDSGVIDNDIKIDLTGIENYRSHVFRNDQEELIIAFWTPVEAEDHFDGKETNLIIESKIPGDAQCIDILNGVSQKMVVFRNCVKTIIPDLKIYDYPIVIKFNKMNGENE